MDWNQVDAVTDEAVEFVLQGQLAECVNGGHQAVMAVNLEISVIFAIFYAGGNETDQPDDTENVVSVLMGHEQVVNLRVVNLHIFQNPQDSVAAACIDHEILAAVAQGETGIVIMGGIGVAGAEYIKLFHIILYSLSLRKNFAICRIYGTILLEKKQPERRQTDMSREEFLRGLENALSGNVPPAVVRDNLRYYDDYIRSERQKGRSENDIMDELGDPRLIARTILDTTPEAAEGEYEEYHPFSSFAGNSGRSSQQENAQQTQSENYGGFGNIHYYNLNKWYWKLLAVVVVILFFTLVLTIIGGILTLLLPLLPVIGIVALVMWLVRGPRG